MTVTTAPDLTLLDQTILQSLRDRGCSTLPDHDHAPCVEEALVDGASLELMRRLLYSWYEYEPDGTAKGGHPYAELVIQYQSDEFARELIKLLCTGDGVPGRGPACLVRLLPGQPALPWKPGMI